MNLDFIIEALENFANWGDPIADVFGALGDLFGEDGLEALSSTDTDNGETGGETGGTEETGGETGGGDDVAGGDVESTDGES